MAGINAHNKINEKDPFILKRSEAYIGVLIDDLVNKGTQEPYRMFTSRAEYRILLRQDNADLRLTEIGHRLGLASDERMGTMLKKKSEIESLLQELQTIKVGPDEVNENLEALKTSKIRERISINNFLKRPEIEIDDLKTLTPAVAQLLGKYTREILDQAEILVKYDSYIDREQKLAQKIESLENFKIKPDFDYDRVKTLSSEAREKLKKLRPETIGQVSRISGVSPADVSVLTVYMGK
jgi:tRNA uridine 5-carboxymethylaminomethyl modification enzyme